VAPGHGANPARLGVLGASGNYVDVLRIKAGIRPFLSRLREHSPEHARLDPCQLRINLPHHFHDDRGVVGLTVRRTSTFDRPLCYTAGMSEDASIFLQFLCAAVNCEQVDGGLSERSLEPLDSHVMA